MKKFLAILVLVLIAITSVSYAAVQKIEADGSYQMGENDSISSAKESAKTYALRQAAEKAGIYIRSYTKTKNYALTDDEVSVVAANVMKVKSCKYTQEYINNTLVFHAHVVVTVDDSKFEEIIKHDKELEDLKDKYEKEKKRNEDIKNQQIQHGSKDMEIETAIYTNTRLISTGDYSKAMFNLSGLITSRKGFVPARIYYLRSAAYFNLEKYNEALSDIKKAITIDSKNPLYYVQEGLIRLAVSQLYLKWRQYGEAKSQYFLAETKCDTALKFKDHYWPAFYCRSISRYLQDTIRKSVNDIDNARRHGGKGMSYVENFSGYIKAQYKGRHKHLAKSPVIPMLTEGVNGLVELKEDKKN